MDVYPQSERPTLQHMLQSPMIDGWRARYSTAEMLASPAARQLFANAKLTPPHAPAASGAAPPARLTATDVFGASPTAFVRSPPPISAPTALVSKPSVRSLLLRQTGAGSGTEPQSHNVTGTRAAPPAVVAPISPTGSSHVSYGFESVNAALDQPQPQPLSRASQSVADRSIPLYHAITSTPADRKHSHTNKHSSPPPTAAKSTGTHTLATSSPTPPRDRPQQSVTYVLRSPPVGSPVARAKSRLFLSHALIKLAAPIAHRRISTGAPHADRTAMINALQLAAIHYRCTLTRRVWNAYKRYVTLRRRYRRALMRRRTLIVWSVFHRWRLALTLSRVTSDPAANLPLAVRQFTLRQLTKRQRMMFLRWWTLTRQQQQARFNDQQQTLPAPAVADASDTASLEPGISSTPNVNAVPLAREYVPVPTIKVWPAPSLHLPPAPVRPVINATAANTGARKQQLSTSVASSRRAPPPPTVALSFKPITLSTTGSDTE